LEEVERICSDELHKTGLFPADPAPIRIDRFIEKRFGAPVIYEQLPNGVLGLTEFGDSGVDAIVINSRLDAEGTLTAERRIKTTIAHECGHGLLHAYLFALGETARPLFRDGLDPARPRVLCRANDVSGTMVSAPKRYAGRWWEFQANQAMGALLLPRLLVDRALEQVLVTTGTLGLRILQSRDREEAARLLASTFEVNPVVARIRLAVLYPEAGAPQLTL
jgi:hypothetical protein